MRWLLLVATLLVALPGWAQNWSSRNPTEGRTTVYEWRDVAVDPSTAVDMTRCSRAVWQYTDDTTTNGDVAAGATLYHCNDAGLPIGSCTSAATFTATTAGESFALRPSYYRLDVTAGTTTSASRARVQGLCEGAAGGDIPVNTRIDQDGDGLFDYMRVTCLYDGDSACSIEDDIDAAVKALNDTGGSTLQIAAGVYDFPGNGVGGSGPAYVNSNGAIEPPVNMRIACDRGAVLVGPDETEDKGLSVIYSAANGVEIIGCELDGGAPASYSWTALGFVGGTARMGIYLLGDKVLIEGNRIHDTFHSGIYYRNGEGARILGNELYDVGGHHATDGLLTQPCVYIFAEGGSTTSDVVVADNICIGVGAIGYNTRKNTTSDTLKNIQFVNNIAKEIRNSAGTPDYNACVSFSGTENSSVNGLICENAESAVQFIQGADYLPNHVSPNRGIIVNGVVAKNMLSTAAWGFNISAYQRDVTITNSIVNGTTAGRDCLGFAQPQRGLILSNLTLASCGGHGIRQTTLGNLTPEERVIFQNIAIRDVDDVDLTGSTYDGINLAFAFSHYVFDGVSIQGYSAQGIDASGDGDFSVFKNLFITPLRSGFQGTTTVGALPACNAAAEHETYIVTDATGSGDCATGGAGTLNMCACQSSSWVDFAWGANDHGIWYRGASPNANLFEGVTCQDITGGNYDCLLIVAAGTLNHVSDVIGMNTIGLGTGTNYVFDSAVNLSGGTTLSGAAPTDVYCYQDQAAASACNQP